MFALDRRAKARRYKARTTVERTNSKLKGCFLPGRLYSRGRGIFQIELSILMLDIKKILERLKAEREAGKNSKPSVQKPYLMDHPDYGTPWQDNM